MYKLSLFLLLMLSFSFSFNFSLQAQQGRAIENFSLPDAISGEQVSLKDYQQHKAIVVLFTSNHCPYSRLYEDRFSALVKEYADSDVAFLIINPNDPRESKEDTMEAMRKKGRSWEINIPYLADKDQRVAKMFGASKTPEVFVLNSQTSGYTVAYSGAIDDNPQVAGDVNQHYLKQALDSVLQRKTVNPTHKRPVGCMIKTRS